MSRIITIVGATGKVGSKTVRNLLGKGHNLRLVARHKDALDDFSRESGVEIHAGSAMDNDFLAGVLKGSDAAFLMMPADYATANYKIYQDELGLAQIQAIKESGIGRILFLSSVGAHTEENTGVVAGLSRQEERLSLLDEVHVLCLRPAYFMENTLNSIGLIKGMNINGSALRPDNPGPMIATKDIAQRAAQYLEQAAWTGKTVQALLGPRDYTMQEITAVIGKGIGKPELPYVQFTYQQAIQAMMQAGMGESVAHGLAELSQGINEGVMTYEKRDAQSTTPTTIEEFVAEVFVPAFKG